MTAGIFARVPAIAVLVTVALLATATLTLAATSTSSAPKQAVPQAAPKQAFLVVPDVRRQAYVFAKGALEQAGFAWKVGGSVQGYSVNVVASQTPAPGSRVIAGGAPIVTLVLSRNATYKEEGLPENESPYAGRSARLVGSKPRVTRAAASAPKPAAKPAVAKRAAKPAAAARKPAFVVPGAPKEPSDEIPLTLRAKQLSTWLDAHRERTPRAVAHWFYQHNWIVTGAAFGWSGGTEALRMLIAIDHRTQQLWGVGARSESLAKRALAEVETRSR